MKRDVGHVDAAQRHRIRQQDTSPEGRSIPGVGTDIPLDSQEVISRTTQSSQELTRSSGHHQGLEKDNIFLPTEALDTLDETNRNSLAQLLLHPSEQPYSLEYIDELGRTIVDLIDEAMDVFADEFQLKSIYWAGLLDDEEVSKLCANIFGPRSDVKMAAYGYKLCRKHHVQPENILRAFVANALTVWLLRDFNDLDWSKQNQRSRAIEQTVNRGNFTIWRIVFGKWLADLP